MLSIILPTIRLEKLPRLIETLNNSVNDVYELICVSPYERPHGIGLNVPDVTKFKWIIDKGNSTRAQQIGLVNATGEYVHRAVDDSLYDVNGLQEVLYLCRPNRVVNIRYTEMKEEYDPNHPVYRHDMQKEEFYEMSYHTQTQCEYVPKGYKIINFAIYPTKVMKDIGGWSCEYESIALAEVDMAVRLQNYGVELVMTPKIVLRCGWEPGEEGTHAPMHHAFPVDLAHYQQVYSNPESRMKINIPLNNWERAPSVWERRFGK